MVRSNEIVQSARSYLGVPYRHQGRNRLGLDCIGLILMVAHDLHLSDFDITGYGRVPSGRMMARLLGQHCRPVAVKDINSGDVVHITFERQPQHVAIITDAGMIHADNIRGVVEHSLNNRWRKKIRGAYRLPGVG